MDGYWMRALDEAERAEARAKTLRECFGPGAEDRCDSEIRSFAAADPRRRRVQDVRRALRWT